MSSTTSSYRKPLMPHDRFGVFVWRGDSRYPIADALVTYKHERAAQRVADALNEANAVHVVRTLAYCQGGAR